MNTLFGILLGAAVIAILWLLATLLQPTRGAEDVCYTQSSVPVGTQTARMTRVRYQPCP